MSPRRMRVAWVGLRGFPGVQGGVEAHAQQICPRLHDLGCDVTVLTRNGYQSEAIGPQWHGVRFKGLWAPRHKHLEAVVHTFLAILYAGLVLRPDILHVQAIGPGLWTLWARLLGLRVVVTHHGPDYERQKWGRLARWVLRLGEASAARWANELIVISKVIEKAVARLHGRHAAVIPNGISPPADAPPAQLLRPFGLTPGRYVLLVSRLVPEKRHLDLIEAFRRAGLPGWKLAITGAADHADAYARSVVDRVAALSGGEGSGGEGSGGEGLGDGHGDGAAVVMTGFQTGAVLEALYAHAGVFVLPSSHEGLPIAILEALSFGVPVIASDIPANLEVGLPRESYFPLGDVDALAARLKAQAVVKEPASARAERRDWATARYSWDRSARATLEVYAHATGQPALRGVPTGPLGAE